MDRGVAEGIRRARHPPAPAVTRAVGGLGEERRSLPPSKKET
jgi:hypothetical protein